MVRVGANAAISDIEHVNGLEICRGRRISSRMNGVIASDMLIRQGSRGDAKFMAGKQS